MMLWDNFSQKKNASVHIRQIVGNQLNRLRIEVSEMFFAGKINAKVMDELYGKVMEASTEKQNMAREVVNVKNALSSGEVSLTPDLSSTESQLLWGTALACVVCDPGVMVNWPRQAKGGRVSQTGLWRAVSGHPVMKQEIMNHAFLIANSFGNDEAKIIWSEPHGGYPNIGYCFDAQNNIVLDDLIWSLIAGIENSRAALQHEIGHCQGTQIPESLKKDAEQAEAVRKDVLERHRAGTIGAEEVRQKELEIGALLNRREFLYLLFDEMENSYANRYVLNQRGENYPLQLNTLETCICGTGKIYLDKAAERNGQSAEKAVITAEEKREDKDSFEYRFKNLKRAIRYSLFKNNNLINDSMEEWHDVGVYPELIEGYDEDGNKMDAARSFEYLLKQCQEMEKRQVSRRHQLLGKDFYKRRIDEFAAERQKIVEDVFERFVRRDLDNELARIREVSANRQISDQQAQKAMRDMAKRAAADNQLRDIARQNRSQPQSDQQQGQPQQGQLQQGEMQDSGQGVSASSGADRESAGQGLQDMAGTEVQQPASESREMQSHAEPFGVKDYRFDPDESPKDIRQQAEEEKRQISGEHKTEDNSEKDNQGGRRPAEDSREQPAENAGSSGKQADENSGESQGGQSENQQAGERDEYAQSQPGEQSRDGDKNEDAGERNGSSVSNETVQENETGQESKAVLEQKDGMGKASEKAQLPMEEENGSGTGEDTSEASDNFQSKDDNSQKSAGDPSENASEKGAGEAAAENSPARDSDGENPARRNLEEEVEDIFKNFDRRQDETGKGYSREELEALRNAAEDIRELAKDFQRQEEQKAVQDQEKREENSPAWEPVSNMNMDMLQQAVKLTPESLQHSVADSSRFFREGNVAEYRKMISGHGEIIARTNAFFKKIKEKQRKQLEQISRKMQLLPEDNSTRGFSLDAHRRLLDKMNGGSSIDLKDFERFKTQNKNREVSASIDVAVLIDGSGSMSGRPFENALTVGCILYEAARNIKDMNIYMYIMSNNHKPLCIAHPDYAVADISKNLERVRGRAYSDNDHILSSVRKFLEDSCEFEKKQRQGERVGVSHIFAVTDGINCDYDQYNVNDELEKIVTGTRFVSLDYLFIDSSWSDQPLAMPLIRKLQNNRGTRKIGYVNINNGEEIPPKMVEMLASRLRETDLSNTPLRREKNLITQKLLNNMKRQGI